MSRTFGDTEADREEKDIAQAKHDASKKRMAPVSLRPLSTYPELRREMLTLCSAVEKSCDDELAVRLADLVRGVLEDEDYA